MRFSWAERLLGAMSTAEPCPPHEWEDVSDSEYAAWQREEYLLVCQKCKDRWPNAARS